MGTLLDATRELSNAEERLKKLLEKAIATPDFTSAKRLIDALELLAAARSALQESTELRDDSAAQVGPNEAGAILNAAPNRKSKDKERVDAYPRFERDGDRLVKIGWSSKSKQTYEHRIDRDAAWEVCAQINAKIGRKHSFKVDQLLPLQSAEGRDIPSYQTYLVLKWLQYLGAVEKRGNDGYQVTGDIASDEALSRFWQMTRVRHQ